MEPEIHIFAHQTHENENGPVEVLMLLRHSTIIEYAGELVPACVMAPSVARMCAASLNRIAAEADNAALGIEPDEIPEQEF